MNRIPVLFSSSALLLFILVLYKISSVYGNSEVDALYALKTHLSDPNNVLQSWDPTTVNPCLWFHVTCNGENSVTRIDLGNANLSGELVPQLGQLANLQYLEMFSNNITGTIPKEIGNLTNLVSLDLFLNRLHGHIPTALGNLQKLRNFRLNNNSLTGTIPYSLTTITTLRVIDLSSNRLSGYVPRNGSFSMFTPISFANNPKLIYPGDVPVAQAPAPAPLNSLIIPRRHQKGVNVAASLSRRPTPHTVTSHCCPIRTPPTGPAAVAEPIRRHRKPGCFGSSTSFVRCTSVSQPDNH